MESWVGKPKLPSIVDYGYRIFLCLVSGYYNTVNAVLLFQIKIIQNGLNILYLCMQLLIRKQADAGVDAESAGTLCSLLSKA